LTDPSFVVHAGPRAAAWVRERGIKPQNISCIPAAAGGLKGLALIPMAQLLFGDGLRDAQPALIGASIGAWRMFAAAQFAPVAALQRLSDGYVAQTCPRRPMPAYVSDECRELAVATLGGTRLPPLRAGAKVNMIAARVRGVLEGDRSRAAFARAALANTLGRERLAAHLQRVIFTAATCGFRVPRSRLLASRACR
jgi:hypothetical protein